jgi:hypothetical protein
MEERGLKLEPVERKSPGISTSSVNGIQDRYRRTTDGPASWQELKEVNSKSPPTPET